MKHFYTLFFVVSFFGFGQCPETNPTFSTQNQIDQFIIDFPNCDNLNILIIEGADVQNLLGLNNLVTINGGLRISNTSLVDLSGLENITFIGSGDYQDVFTIQNNANLTSISALVNAESSIGLDILISNNPSLLSLQGLNTINNEVQGLNIRNNKLLESLFGLENINRTEDFIIESNENLKSLNGLQNLELVGGGFYFENNGLVEDFFPINSVELSCQISILNNAILDNIEGFILGSLDCGNGVSIRNNPMLSNCALSYVCEFLMEAALDSLSSVEISGNGADCSNLNDVLANCETAPTNDDCENALIIDVGETVQSNNQLGTESPFIPTCNSNGDIIDVWFTFNSGDFTTLDISVNAGFNIQLWEGECTALTTVANGCAAENINDVAVVTDTDYYLQVWSTESDSGRNAQSAGLFNLIIQDGTLSAETNAFKNFKIYPNPISGILNFNSNHPVDAITIYSSLGQKAVSIEPTLNNGEINMETFASGLYFVVVLINDNTSTYKLLKD